MFALQNLSAFQCYENNNYNNNNSNNNIEKCVPCLCPLNSLPIQLSRVAQSNGRIRDNGATESVVRRSAKCAAAACNVKSWAATLQLWNFATLLLLTPLFYYATHTHTHTYQICSYECKCVRLCVQYLRTSSAALSLAATNFSHSDCHCPVFVSITQRKVAHEMCESFYIYIYMYVCVCIGVAHCQNNSFENYI